MNNPKRKRRAGKGYRSRQSIEFIVVDIKVFQRPF